MAKVGMSRFFNGWLYGITSTFFSCQLYPSENYSKILLHCLDKQEVLLWLPAAVSKVVHLWQTKFNWRIATPCHKENVFPTWSRLKPWLL